jgi:hypothetical protein
VAPDCPGDEVAFMEPGGEFDSVLNIGTVIKKRQLK